MNPSNLAAIDSPRSARLVSPPDGAPRPEARGHGAARKLGRIDIHDDPTAALAAWGELEDACPGSIYQTRRFLLPWIATLGRDAGIEPMIVVAHDARGAPVAFLPFGVTRRGPFRVAAFLGGADSNANLGLYRPDVLFSPADLESLLRAVAVRAPRKPDLFLLINQPTRWEGVANPLDIFPHQWAASFCHRTELMPDPRRFEQAHQSKDALKKLGKKRRRLETMGLLTHVVARDATTTDRILDAFFAQKLERFRRQNIDSVFESEASRIFLDRATRDGLDGPAPTIELHALQLGDRIIATYGGGAHRGHFHMMFNSFDADIEVARSSPGDLLLQSILERQCQDGLKSFDLGIGEARYKNAWCDEAEPLFDSILAVTAKGRVYAAAEAARRRAKRWIKQSEWAWPLARKLLRRG